MNGHNGNDKNFIRLTDLKSLTLLTEGAKLNGVQILEAARDKLKTNHRRPNKRWDTLEDHQAWYFLGRRKNELLREIKEARRIN